MRLVAKSPGSSPLRCGKLSERPPLMSVNGFQRAGSSPPSPELLLPVGTTCSGFPWTSPMTVGNSSWKDQSSQRLMQKNINLVDFVKYLCVSMVLFLNLGYPYLVPNGDAVLSNRLFNPAEVLQRLQTDDVTVSLARARGPHTSGKTTVTGCDGTLHTSISCNEHCRTTAKRMEYCNKDDAFFPNHTMLQDKPCYPFFKTLSGSPNVERDPRSASPAPPSAESGTINSSHPFKRTQSRPPSAMLALATRKGVFTSTKPLPKR